MSGMKEMKIFMKGNRGIYWIAIISVVLTTLLSMINPLIIKTTIDAILGDKPITQPTMAALVEGLGGSTYLSQHLYIIGLVMVCIAALAGIFNFLKGKLSAVASENGAKNMRDQLYHHIQYLPFESHAKLESGDLIQRCTSDLETIRKFLATQFVAMGQAISTLVVSIAIMLSLDLKLTLIAMVLIPPIFVFSFLFFKKVVKAFEHSDTAEGKMSSGLQENLSGMRVVRAFAREKYEIERFDVKNKEFTDLTYELIRLHGVYWGISDAMCLIQMGIVLIAGSYMTYMGEITLGTLTVFITYEGMLLWPVRMLGRILTDLGKTKVSLGRIGNILAMPVETSPEDALKPNLKGKICFDKVSFAYTPDNPVLSNVSFQISPGQTLAILGPTGAGKSTLVHLLTRLYDCTSGRIFVDDTDIKQIDKQHLRKQIGIILQEPFLFGKTLRENMTLAVDNPSDELLAQYTHIASLEDVVNEFEEGYETMVGEKGVSLSGGQKQRVAIARTLMTQCPILIFDDSLSAVDTETDQKIQKSLSEMAHQATKIIISHRISSIINADLILVLEEGQLKEMGKHQDLIHNNGLYSRIWDLQSNLSDLEETV